MKSSAELTASPSKAGVVHDSTSFERLPRPGIAASDDEVHTGDLDPVDESPDRAAPEIDEVVDEVRVFEGRADDALVVGGVQVEDEVQVAGHARLRVDGERPRSGHEVTDQQPIEPIEDLAFGVHSPRSRTAPARSVVSSCMAWTAYPPASLGALANRASPFRRARRFLYIATGEDCRYHQPVPEKARPGRVWPRVKSE